MRSLGARALKFQLDSYLRNAVDRDVPEQGLDVRKPDAMLGWLRAYAAATSTTASYTATLDAATAGVSDKPARSTTIVYRDVLSQLWLLDPVPAWGPRQNRWRAWPNRRSITWPILRWRRVYLAYPWICSSAVKAGRSGLRRVACSGISSNPWSHFAYGLLRRLPRPLSVTSERNGDHEIDLVVVRDDGKVLAVEVKLAAAVEDRDTAHLRWLADHLRGDLLDAIIINTGLNAYRRPDGIGVVPLALLGQ